MSQFFEINSQIKHIAVCITFHYDENRFIYLNKVVSNYIKIPSRVDIYIITNRRDSTSKQLIVKSLPELPGHVNVTFITPEWLGHPYLLTWVHREVFNEIIKNPEISHFLYTEDDLNITIENLSYWLHYRPKLRKYGLIPSFFRVEKHPEIGWCSTDCLAPIYIPRQPQINLTDDYQFICLPNPYQGMYFLDRELIREFANSRAMSPDFGQWFIREKASAGLTFVNVPKGFTSRNVVPFCPSQKTIPQDCWIHHLPNNYANDPVSKFGKLPLNTPGLFLSSFDFQKLRLRKKLKKRFRRIISIKRD